MIALQKDLALVLSDIDMIAELCDTAMQDTNQNLKNTSDYDYKELRVFVEDTIDTVEYNEIAKQAVKNY